MVPADSGLGAPLIEAMNQAIEGYTKASPGKGKPHPMGARRVTVAGALLLMLSKAELDKIDGEGAELLNGVDKMLVAVGRRHLREQQKSLKALLELLTTPQMFEPAVTEASWFLNKKKTKYICVLGIAPAHPVHECVDFIYVLMQ
eukprot:2545512-Alexandrium_andersonii.AAC.1